METPPFRIPPWYCITYADINKSDISKALYGAEPDDRKMQAIFRTLEIDNDAKKISDEKITAIENNLDEIIIALRDVLDVVNPIPLDETSAGKAKPKKRKKSEQEDWEKKIDGILKDGKKGLSALGKALAKIMDGGKAVDLALFGRMLADMPERNQNAACQVAHAISTHAVEREFDFYTAVDDLKPEDTAGADMMGTVEFNSACFYRYAVVDWEKLNENLQGDVELAKKGLKAFLEGFVMAEPTGKQNTFAAHNPPEFVAVSVRSNTAPRNLANAFETAIRVRKDESITKESATKLIEKAKALAAAFDAKNANRQTHILNLVEANTTGFGTNVESMVDLLTKVLENVKNGKG
jgi:CRISPR-associated protein Cas7/Cse4/CasC subtype I-E